MKVVRSGLSVVAYDNAIYAIAGKNDFSPLASMEVYDEDTNEWEIAAYLTSARSCLGAVVLPVSLTKLAA
ncbi:kelch repeat protein [Ancylostoma caninum]|uniref:Kelch repeat protein n=1 Tax=Ancylostoma caninum TaxID=29170 RepID=A0A368H4L8_ANCCA|nr:kelch repeat protein [Ancylostoma caninum]